MTTNPRAVSDDFARVALARELAARSGDVSFHERLAATHPHLFSEAVVRITRADADLARAVVEAVETVAALPAWRAAVFARASAVARRDPGPRGVFMGFDFHLTAEGPRLIEINTNAGGALLNAALARARLHGDEKTTMPATDIETAFVAMFREEWRRQRGAAPLARAAIVDDAPATQYLYPEFVLFQRLLARHGIETIIADAAELAWRGGGLYHAERRIDLIYNRLTDFYLEEPAHAALRAAYEADAVVLTPHPHAHALYADKRDLILLSDADALREMGAAPQIIDTLTRGVARTVPVAPAHAGELWDARRRWFFKPALGYGGKAVYRGEKLTRRVWGEILAAGDYVAQAFVPPGEHALAEGMFKFDVRAYVYGGGIQLFAARLYQGQATNFRTPGGGFAPVCVTPGVVARP